MRDLSRGLQLGLRAGIAVLSLLVLVGSGLAWATYQQFTSNIPHGAPVPKSADADGTSQNILLLGNDSRAGATAEELKALSTQEDGGSVNTDTMMLLHVPADGSQPSVVSFPRDAWVTIPGHGKGKINAAYPDAYSDAKAHGATELEAVSAGINLLAQTINSLTGLHIDHYVEVNLLGFYRISQAIGGVTVCLKQAQNPETDSDEYGKGYSGINLPAGVSTIEGSQALAFVRQRHGLPNGDLDRIRRQQYFLAAALRRVTSSGVLLNPFKLHALLSAVSSSLLTDPDLDLGSLAQQFSDLSSGAVKFETLPNNGPQMIYPDGVATSIVEVNTAGIPAFLAKLEGKPAADALAAVKPDVPSAVTLDVLNGAGVTGLAGRNADALRTAGFHVGAVDSTEPTNATAIEYPAGAEPAAKAVAASVPKAQLVQTAAVTRVTLVLGTDGVQATGAAPSSSAPAPAPAVRSQAQSPAPSPAPAAPAAAGGLGCID